MDPWVNSLVQSPLVRSLNTIPSRMSSFAHGVRDNVPPFSMNKVEVKSSIVSSGWDDAPSGKVTEKFTFVIPQYGLLDRMYLKVRIRCKHAPQDATPANTVDTVPVEGTQVLNKIFSSSWNFAEFLDYVELKTNSKTITKLFPGSIAFEVQQMSSSARSYWMKGMAGYAAADPRASQLGTESVYPFMFPFDLGATGNNAVDPYIQNQMVIADFLIPLPFDVVKQLKDNFQTRFVEDLQVLVQTKSYPGYHARALAAGTDSINMSLVCHYHNFHDVIENSIRDQNYKRGFPASVYLHSYTKEDTNAPSTGSNRLIIDLKSNHLVTDLILVLQKKASTSPQYHITSTPTSYVSKLGNIKVTLMGSGRELWKTTWTELAGPDVQDYELADGHPYGEDACVSSLELPVNPMNVRSDTLVAFGAAPTGGGVLYSFALNMRSIRFGFQSNANYYTGGLALQTISNPRLILEVPTNWDDHTCTVYSKYAMLVRIDSDTGVINTALDV